MYVQSKSCSVSSCGVSGGRKHSVVDTEEEVILCVLCGINGTHLQCSSLTLDQAEDWKCGDCGGEQ